MAWSDAKAAIAALLAGVSITEPTALDMKTVYTDAPGRIPPADTPAVVMFPPSVEVVRDPGGWREKHYGYRVRLYVHDARYARAAAIVESFVEEVIDAFDDTSSVRGNGVQIINGPRVDEPTQFDYAGATYLGVDFFFDVQMGEPKTFG